MDPVTQTILIVLASALTFIGALVLWLIKSMSAKLAKLCRDMNQVKTTLQLTNPMEMAKDMERIKAQVGFKPA